MQKNNSLWARLRTHLEAPVDAINLSMWRALFGAVLLWEAWRFVFGGKVYKYFLAREFWFPYPYFEFIRPLSAEWMYGIFGLFALCSACLMLGFHPRKASVGAFFTYSYVMMIDKTEYNNHYYLTGLLLLVFASVGSGRSFTWPKSRGSELIPRWHADAFRYLIALVYFYGGIAKLNPDWLAGEPMRHWLPNTRSVRDAGLEQVFGSELSVMFFSYGGLLYDLLIGFLLINRRLRPIGIVTSLFFHLTNNWLFSIGVFPVMMICSLVLFIDAKHLRRLTRLPTPSLEGAKPYVMRPKVMFAIIAFATVQILVPFRHWLIPGDVTWTEEGHAFSWRMKLRSKRGRVTFYVEDPDTGGRHKVNEREWLDKRQVRKMKVRPHMIVQFAHFLASELQEPGQPRPIIKVKARLSLNYRQYAVMIDPDINLANVSYNPWGHNGWITMEGAELRRKTAAAVAN